MIARRRIDRRTLVQGTAAAMGSMALVRIAPGALGIDAPLLGAAELALEPFLADPAAWLTPRAQLATAAAG